MAARPPLSLKARALQWLAQREHSRLELPIIGLSAEAFASERADALAAGMNDFVVKPIEPRKLERAILRAVAARMEVLR